MLGWPFAEIPRCARTPSMARRYRNIPRIPRARSHRAPCHRV